MLDIYSYKKTSEELSEIKINNDVLNKLSKLNLNGNIIVKIREYIKSYNSLLDLEIKKNNNNINNINDVNEFKLCEDYTKYSIEKFLVNKKNDINKLNHIYNNFIKYQNNIICALKNKYFKNMKIEQINVQDAKEENVLKFSSSDDEFLKIVMNNTEIINLENKDQQNIFKFNYRDIENDLGEKNKPGLKMFNIGKIRTIKYSGDLDNESIIDDFNKKYQIKNLNQEKKDVIKNKFIENIGLNKIDDFLLEIRKLMLYILKHECKEEDEIQTIFSYEDFNNIELDLIKSFFNSTATKVDDEDDIDILDMMNNENQQDNSNDNIKYDIGILYSIYQIIENLKELNN
jgi:hypothetical protein